MSKNTGGPAFPNQVKITDEAFSELLGMTLRDWFAGKAMEGLIASPKTIADGTDPTNKWYAKAAYIMADAMLAERERTNE